MEILLVTSIIFFAFLIRSTFGFGDALVAMPLLVMIIGVQEAAPLMALLALCMALMIMLKNRQYVSFSVSWKLVLSAIPGIPVGLLYLKHINEGIVNTILAVLIIVFAVVRLMKIMPAKKAPPIFTWFTGFISGILGGAYNTNGPPVIMFLSSQNWPPRKFRSTLQGYFFFTGIGVVLGHMIWGNVNAQVFGYFLFGLPALVISFLLGEYWFGKFKSEKFYKWVYVLLIIIGTGLILKVMI